MRGGEEHIAALTEYRNLFLLFYFTSMERKESNGWGHIFFGFFLFLYRSPRLLVSFSLGKWVLFVTEPLFPICTIGVFSLLVIIITLLS